MKRGDYSMSLVLIPMDGPDPRYPEGAICSEICTRIHGTPLECAAMLQNMAADIMTSIKNEIEKKGD